MCFTLTASTHDQEVFSFYPDDRCCDGFEEVLTRYRELVPQLRLAGLMTTLIFIYYYYYFLYGLVSSNNVALNCANRSDIICPYY